jgi:hypothetical protein
MSHLLKKKGESSYKALAECRVLITDCFQLQAFQGFPSDAALGKFQTDYSENETKLQQKNKPISDRIDLHTSVFPHDVPSRTVARNPVLVIPGTVRRR